MNPKTIDRALIVLNAFLLVSVALFVSRPGGILHRAVSDLLLERRARRFLAQGWQEITSGAPILAGDPVNVEVVLFSDYECPFCRAMYPSLDSLGRRSLNAGVALRHLAPGFHPNARRAALAAICADAQGQFRAMNSLLFTARLDSISLEWGRAAASSGVPDIAEFLRCMADPGTSAQLSSDSVLADELGIHATPTLVTRSGRYPGMTSETELLTLLGAADVAP
jgi:protein-disulfide isomerase